MFYTLVRQLTCPFDQIAKYVPSDGFLLDVGCGHGIFAHIAAKVNKNLQVLGMDPSDEKIEQARKYTLPNLTFKKAFIDDISGSFDCVSIIDVLYLFDHQEKVTLLKKAYQLLKPGGRLILVINGTGSSLIYKFLQFQENMMVKYLKLTFSLHNKTYFADQKEYREILESLGLKVTDELSIRAFLPYPHVMFVAHK